MARDSAPGMSKPRIELFESRVIYSTADLEADFPDHQPEPGELDPPDADRGVQPIGPMHMHSLMDLPNGDLVVFFTADDDHWFRRVCGIRSHDRGQTWKIDPEGETFATSSWCVLEDGSVYLLGHERTPSWQMPDGSLCCIGNGSRNGGTTFDGPRLIPCEIPGISVVEPFEMKRSPNTPFPRRPTAFGRKLISEVVGSERAAVAFPTDRIVRLPDGGLLVTCQCTFGETEKKDRTGFLKSTDTGKSWSLVSFIDLPDYRFSEACLELTLDGKVMCIARSRQDEPTPLFQTYSDDGGATWSELEPLDVCGVRPGLLRLKSGMLLCSFGRTGPDSFASAAGEVIGDNKVMLSPDDGKTWESVTTVFDGRSTGYIVVAEMEPNRLQLIYDEQIEPGIRYEKRARWVIRAVEARINI